MRGVTGRLVLAGLVAAVARPLFAADAGALQARMAAVAAEALYAQLPPSSGDVPSAPAPVELLSTKPPRGGAGNYIDAASLPEVARFPPPPSPDSSAQKADLATLHRWQDKRTAGECSRARAEQIPTFDTLFGSVSPFPSPLPADAARFFSRVSADADSAAGILKNRFQRPRPPLQDSTLQPCAKLPSGNSYPSFHATLARVFALILSDLAPARRAEFIARGDQAGLDRVIAGVHFPSDVAASRNLADDLYAEFGKSSAFKSDLDALRGEVSASTR